MRFLRSLWNLDAPLFSLDFDVYIICVGPHFISQGDRPGVTSRVKREWGGRGGVEGKRLRGGNGINTVLTYEILKY